MFALSVRESPLPATSDSLGYTKLFFHIFVGYDVLVSIYKEFQIPYIQTIVMRESEDILDLKKLVERGDLVSLQAYLEDCVLEETDQAYMFHRIYLHACLKKQTAIATWFQEVYFPTLDPIQQIALRQIFPYGRHLLSKR